MPELDREKKVLAKLLLQLFNIFRNVAMALRNRGLGLGGRNGSQKTYFEKEPKVEGCCLEVDEKRCSLFVGKGGTKAKIAL